MIHSLLQMDDRETSAFDSAKDDSQSPSSHPIFFIAYILVNLSLMSNLSGLHPLEINSRLILYTKDTCTYPKTAVWIGSSSAIQSCLDNLTLPLWSYLHNQFRLYYSIVKINSQCLVTTHFSKKVLFYVYYLQILTNRP